MKNLWGMVTDEPMRPKLFTRVCPICPVAPKTVAACPLKDGLEPNLSNLYTIGNKKVDVNEMINSKIVTNLHDDLPPAPWGISESCFWRFWLRMS